MCKFACRVLMDLQAQLELLDREALWVSQVKEGSVECQACQDLRCVHLYLDTCGSFRHFFALLSCVFLGLGPTRKAGICWTIWREGPSRSSWRSWR